MAVVLVERYEVHGHVAGERTPKSHRAEVSRPFDHSALVLSTLAEDLRSQQLQALLVETTRAVRSRVRGWVYRIK